MPEPPQLTPEDKIRNAIFGSAEELDPKDAQIAQLQEQIQTVKENAAEERFLWVLVFVAATDMVFLGNMQNWSAPIVIGLVELIGVVIWADRCGVNAVAPLIDRLTGMLGSRIERQK